MRRRREPLSEKQERLHLWKPWFAWRPIRTLENEQVWLETVERSKHLNWGGWTNYYRDVGSIAEVDEE